MSNLSVSLKLLRKFGHPKLFGPLKNSVKRADEIAEDIYSKPITHPKRSTTYLLSEELEAIRSHESRIANSIGFESLAIYEANRGVGSLKSEDAADLTAHQILIGLSASMEDDVQDIFLVPYLAHDFKNWDVKDVLEIITNEEKFYSFSLQQGPKVVGKKLIIPWAYAGAMIELQRRYSEFLQKRSKRAHPVYKEYRGRSDKIQARDIAVSALLLRGDVEGAMDVVKKTNPRRDYSDNAMFMLTKVGDPAEGTGGIIYRATSPVYEKGIEDALKKLFSNLANLSQAAIDDAKSIRKDVIERSQNLFITLALPYTRSVDFGDIRLFWRENLGQMDWILRKFVLQVYSALQRLKSYDFGYETFKLGIDYTMERSRSGMRELEKELGYDLNWYWWDLHKERAAEI